MRPRPPDDVIDQLVRRRPVGISEALPSTGGGSFSTSVERASATDGSTWSVIVKRLQPGRPGWDRELTATSAGLLDSLPSPLRAPELLASVRDEQGAVLVFEDLGPTEAPTIDGLAAVVEALASWSRRKRTPAPWWTADALADEFTTLADHPDRLAATPADGNGDPPLQQLRRQLRELLRAAKDDLETVRHLPTGVAHLDAYSRNLVFRSDADSIGLVDWANVGTAPLPTDAATTFTLSLDYLDIDADDIAKFRSALLDALHRASGSWTTGRVDDDLTSGFSAICRLRHLTMMMNALPMAERRDPAVSAIVGRPLDVIVDQWLEVGEHLLSHR